MDHFIGIYRYVVHPNYTIDMPHASWFVPDKVHKSQDNDKPFFDRLEVNYVIFNLYEEYRQTLSCEEIYWYFDWIKCGHKMVYCHFSFRAGR